ncbi:AsnC family transcriptional regulator, partial [Burkholderia cenocepacia]|uniref:AsnC family transcriptional regulator n=1 Tax=Burkholderia cenocepacia TaxID=95486 RepID=UPI00403F7A2C
MRHLLTSDTNRNRSCESGPCRLGAPAFGAIIASLSTPPAHAYRPSVMRPPRLDQLDDLDRQLVALLQADARASVADLARQLD